MNKINLTFFNATGDGKHPLSPTFDKEFIFVSQTFDDLTSAYKFMINEWSLSKPLIIETPFKSRRLIKNLKPFEPEIITNIAIDIDDVRTVRNYEKIVDYFKKEKLSIILGKSKNFNGKTKFNLKGILRLNLTNKKENIEYILDIIKNDISSWGTLDMSVLSTASLQAPTKQEFVVYVNECGKVYSDTDIDVSKLKEKIEHNQIDSELYNDKLVNKCLEAFVNKGFINLKNNGDNGCLNFKHSSEVKSKGGFFWFPDYPFMMHHHNKVKSVNIFNEIKDTPEVKEYIKKKTLIEQKNKLLDNYSADTYVKNLKVKERYLDISDKNKVKIINDFIKSEKGILKIKSSMGTAKSTIIEHCIKTAHTENQSVIIVSNRISVSLDFSEKYNIMHYKDPESWEHKGSIVVQFDSLWKFDVSNYDMVIFDEFASLLLHHRANLSDNSNINAVKFKILLDTKKVVLADAFLTGYEDVFIKNREIFSIENRYRDDIDIFEYKDKEYFIKNLIDKSIENAGINHISCSFTSLNIMKYVEHRLIEEGIKVISLSSETSPMTREIIYKRFKEENHNSFEVILFTPTLTVGVSILNNTKYHFHYDSGMSADVISSLQMIKRSRKAQEIHYFLEERQFFRDMDYNSIDIQAEKYIKEYYNKRDKTLLVDVDYETGNLKLQPLAKYINKIEAYYNILENNHANAFRILLGYQFSKKPLIVVNTYQGLNLTSEIKKIKEKQKEKTLEIINKYANIEWDEFDLEIVKQKMVDLKDDEKAKLIMGKLQERFSKQIPRDKLVNLTKLEIENNFSFCSKVKNFNLAVKAFKDNDYSLYILSKAISTDISNLQNKSVVKFLEFLTNISSKENFDLKMSYTKKDILLLQEKFNIKKIATYFNKMGYNWVNSKLQLDFRIVEYLQYI